MYVKDVRCENLKIVIREARGSENRTLVRRLCEVIKSSLNRVSLEICEDGQGENPKSLRDADFLITFDLNGFEQSTLAGGISYNLLNCKQIHFLLNRNLSNESYLSKQLSLSMFFFCSDNAYYHYLLDTYPDIPYLEPILSQEKADAGDIDADALWLSACKVLKMCKLSDAIEERSL